MWLGGIIQTTDGMSYHLIMSSPLHFTLQQHSQQCQYVTVECRNPGCGQRVLLAKMEIHLKEECPRRRVKCKNCDEAMFYNELQASCVNRYTVF